MNRVIKFRAWNDLGAGMYAWEDLVNTSDNKLCDVFKSMEHAEFTLMQFTGLLDKNGKEIYEGDLVRHYSRDLPYEVQWWNGHFWLYRGNVAIDDGNDDSDPVHVDWREWEIIGNIYEHPNLLTP